MTKQKLIRTRPEINIDEAEKIISNAPIKSADEKKEIKEETKKSEQLQKYILIYPRTVHNRIKVSVAKMDKRNIKDWLLEAIEEKLEKEGY